MHDLTGGCHCGRIRYRYRSRCHSLCFSHCSCSCSHKTFCNIITVKPFFANLQLFFIIRSRRRSRLIGCINSRFFFRNRFGHNTTVFLLKLF